MFIILILIGSVLIALLRGGNIMRFADLEIRWQFLMLLGFLIQILVFSDLWQTNNKLYLYTPHAYLSSLLLLSIALAVNYHIPGMIFLVLGFLSNALAIVSNGGFMPASPPALASAGMSPLAPGFTYNNSIGMGPDTMLWFLGDVFAIPRGVPLPNIFSIGDVLIAVGLVYLIQNVMVQKSQQA